MEHDEYEMQVEYSEMTAFNFNSKEYQEVKNDVLKCKDAANGIEAFAKRFFNIFKPQTV